MGDGGCRAATHRHGCGEAVIHITRDRDNARVGRVCASVRAGRGVGPRREGAEDADVDSSATQTQRHRPTPQVQPAVSTRWAEGQ